MLRCAFDKGVQVDNRAVAARSSRSFIAEGRLDDIARDLSVSPLTVRTHIQRAMTKLHARDRAQLVVIAYQTGLVEPAGRSG